MSDAEVMPTLTSLDIGDRISIPVRPTKWRRLAAWLLRRDLPTHRDYVVTAVVTGPPER